MGHKATGEANLLFYLKSVDNLSTMEWQHVTADYKKVLEKGIDGIIDEIDESLKVHYEEEEIEFLNALKKVANTSSNGRINVLIRHRNFRKLQKIMSIGRIL